MSDKVVQLRDFEHRRLASDPLPGESAKVVILPVVRIERHETPPPKRPRRR